MRYATRFSDAGLRSVVARRDGEHHLIARRVGPDGPHHPTYLYMVGGAILQDHPKQLIGLVHQPLPEGVTEEEMFNAAMAAMALCLRLRSEGASPAQTEEAMDKAAEAIAACQLSKPVPEKEEE